jgi:hypothetical protein
MNEENNKKQKNWKYVCLFNICLHLHKISRKNNNNLIRCLWINKNNKLIKKNIYIFWHKNITY